MITSKSNDIIKNIIKLKTKKYSKERGLCVVESIKLIYELYEKGLLETILVIDKKYELVKHFKNVKIEIISEEIAKFISDAVTTDGVIAICKIPQNKGISYNKSLILDRIQDPSNMGAIIRSARAFGFTTIFTLDSTYPYTFKCIRSSMGHVFGVSIIDVTLDELKKIKIDNNIQFITADMDGCAIEKYLKTNENFAIIIGNEGSGVSEDLRKLSDKIVSIPMDKDVESLNASVSAGIIMYYLK